DGVVGTQGAEAVGYDLTIPHGPGMVKPAYRHAMRGENGYGQVVRLFGCRQMLRDRPDSVQVRLDLRIGWCPRCQWGEGCARNSTGPQSSARCPGRAVPTACR